MNVVEAQKEGWNENESAVGVTTTLDNQLLTFYLDKQIFGIPVKYIKDIFKSTEITKVPLAPSEVAGVVNLRGHIVTAIDLRHKLCIAPPKDALQSTMNIAVDVGEEMYSFIVDKVADVAMFSKKDFEANPTTLDEKLKELSMGIYKLEGKLLIVLDVKKIINCAEKQ